jgi:hypothetical protein
MTTATLRTGAGSIPCEAIGLRIARSAVVRCAEKFGVFGNGDGRIEHDLERGRPKTRIHGQILTRDRGTTDPDLARDRCSIGPASKANAQDRDLC